VDHKIDVIHQDPFAFRVSLNMKRASAQFAKLFFDAFSDRLIVTAGGAGADHKVIGERADIVQVDHHDVLRLLVEGGFKGLSQLVVFLFLGNSLLPHE
jgi:hypothetical protein